MESITSDDDLSTLEIAQRRPGEYGTKGNKIRLLANHFKVSVHGADVIFHKYHVKLLYEDDKPVQILGVRRKVIEKLQEIYALTSQGCNRGCLLVGQSFFNTSLSNSIDLPGGLKGLQGYHSSFRVTQSGLSLNVDVSTTTIVRPGPVIDFLRFNQDIKDTSRIDWGKVTAIMLLAEHVLKRLRIKTTHTNAEFTIFCLSEKSCYEQTFLWKKRNGNGSDTVEVTVYGYFKQQN
nr:unnamed protein product [Digitaria exilis]